MAMMSVMQPKKVKDVRELPNAVQDWEVKVKNLKVEHDIEVDERIEVALMTSVRGVHRNPFVSGLRVWGKLHHGHTTTAPSTRVCEQKEKDT